MLLVFETLMILVLSMVLFTLYNNERILSRSAMPQADMEEYWEGPDRRKHVRFKKKLVVYYRIIRDTRANNRCRTIDISEGGMKLLLNEKLDKNAVLCLKIAIPKPGNSVDVKGEVAWTEEVSEKDAFGRRLFYAGIKFSATNDPKGTGLVNYIRSLDQSLQELVA